MLRFKRNKYRRWYVRIIASARNRKKFKFSERHHVIPTCLGGPDRKINTVFLTPREHFVCHWLLTKFVISKRHQYQVDNAMVCFLMNNPYQNRKLTSLEYEVARKKAFSSFGRPKSDETRFRMSQSQKGKKLSDEHRLKISLAKKGKKIHTIESKNKIRQSLEKIWTVERRKSFKRFGGKNARTFEFEGTYYGSLKEAAEKLGVGPRTVARWLEKGTRKRVGRDVAGEKNPMHGKKHSISAREKMKAAKR